MRVFIWGYMLAKGVQCRMARAALKWTMQDLADSAGVAKMTIKRFEDGGGVQKATISKITSAFEAEGIHFAMPDGVYASNEIQSTMNGMLYRLADLEAKESMSD